MRRAFNLVMISLACLALLHSGAGIAAESASEEPAPEPITTDDPEIAIEDLEAMVNPLTKEDLAVEADGWLELLKGKVEQVTAAQLEINRTNREMAAAAEVADKAKQAKESLENVESAAGEAEAKADATSAGALVDRTKEAQMAVSDAGEAVDKAGELATEAPATGEEQQEAIAEAKQALEEAESSTQVAADAAEAAQADPQSSGESAATAAAAAHDAGQAMGDLEAAAEEAVAESADASVTAAEKEVALEQVEDVADVMEQQGSRAKDSALKGLNTLRAERTALIDRLNVVLAEMTKKIGTTAEGRDPDEVLAYRRYVDAVSGLKLDVTDAEATTASLLGWAMSAQGGLRWAKNIGIFLATVVAFWLLGRLLSRGVAKALEVANVSSVLLRHFLVASTRRVALAVGLIMGLSALEVNIGPLLALIGAAGFVVGFALQGTLSNFASGIMIMFYKPFDVGDYVDVAGVDGTVQSMNLVSTTITTLDNKLMVVPNNSIWGNIITNVTGSAERRVDMVFGIGYDDDIEKAERVLHEIVEGHELVLETPTPMIRVSELADSSVNFIVRPWAKTPDVFSVKLDITRQVKERFDAEGISIPFPQRDVHVHQAALPHPAPQANGTAERRGDGPKDSSKSGPTDLPSDETDADEQKEMPEG